MTDPLEIRRRLERTGVAAVRPGGLLERELDEQLTARLVRLGADGLDVRDGRRQFTSIGAIAGAIDVHVRERHASLAGAGAIVLPDDPIEKLVCLEQLLAEHLRSLAPSTWRELARPLWRLVRRARSEIRTAMHASAAAGGLQ